MVLLIMAYIVDRKLINKQIILEVSKILCNEVKDIRWQWSPATDRDTLSIFLKNKEVFGNILKIETEPRSLITKGISEVFKEVLSKAIEHLPRADRIERTRIWGLN